MSIPHLLLIDGNNIAHANHNTTTLTVGAFQVQAIFGFIRSMKFLMENTRGHCKPLVLWDGKAKFRFELFEDYKGNRTPLDAEGVEKRKHFEAQTPFIELILKYLGVPQMRCPYLEADDLAGYMVKTRRGKPTTLVSGDKDWIGLVNEDTIWFDPIVDRKVTHDTFLEKTGFINPAAYYEGKALQGDNSDNIPGIEDMGPKTAQLFLAKWGSFERFFAAVDAGTAAPEQRKSKKAKSLHPEQLLNSPEGRALVRRNLRLMDLLNSPQPVPADLVITRQPPDVEKFKALCGRLNFATFLRNMPELLRAFDIQPAALAA